MDKVNQIIAKIQKHRLLLGVIAVIIIGYLISLIPRPGTRPFTPTQPILPQITPTPFSAQTYTQTFSTERYIKITDNQQIVAVNQEKQLVQYLGDTPFPITPDGLTVVDYQTRGGSLVYEAGTYANPDNAFYLLSLTNKFQVKLNTTPYKPIINYSINSTEKSLAFLGKYDATKSISTLYLYDLSTNITTPLEENITANSVSWLNDNYLLISNKIDVNIGPNNFINIFSLSTKEFIVKNIPALDRSVTFSDTNGLLYFVNSKNNILTSLNLSSATFTDVLKLTTLPTDMFFNRSNNSLVLLIADDSGLLVRIVDPNQKKVIKDVSLQLDKDEIYIEHFQSGSSHFIKTYNRNFKHYVVKYLPL